MLPPRPIFTAGAPPLMAFPAAPLPRIVCSEPAAELLRTIRTGQRVRVAGRVQEHLQRPEAAPRDRCGAGGGQGRRGLNMCRGPACCALRCDALPYPAFRCTKSCWRLTASAWSPSLLICLPACLSARLPACLPRGLQG